MALTRFPVVTDQPTAQVTLPPGRHTLELVVEDSAGMQSAPDTVIITVVREAPVPSITGIQPTSALPGATVDAVIAGANLEGASEVRFSGTGIIAESLRGGTARELPVRLAIDPRALPGARKFAVTTPGGVAETPPEVLFTVIRLIPPTIEPTIFPTIEPTIRPTIAPTIEPTILPTIGPTIRPTLEPIVDVGPILSPERPVRVRGRVAERPVDEVSGIGPAFSKRLRKKGITNLTKLASMEPRRLAEILEVSEVRAMALIDEARRLLQG